MRHAILLGLCLAGCGDPDLPDVGAGTDAGPPQYCARAVVRGEACSIAYLCCPTSLSDQGEVCVCTDGVWQCPQVRTETCGCMPTVIDGVSVSSYRCS